MSLPEYQDQYLKDMLASAREVGEQPVTVPDRQIAGLTPGQLEAVRLGYEGVGAYQPLMTEGQETLGSGVRALEQGIQTARSGEDLLRRSVGSFDPNAIQEFMDPYMEDVVRQAEKDIRRQEDISRKGLKDRAVAAGAFGGSRAQIAESELARNTADQMARTGAQLRSQGFQQASDRAQRAFENETARQQSAAQLFGALGQGIGSLGTGMGKLGIGQAALGESAQGAQQRDINTLLGLGGLEQGQAQTELDAARATALEQQYEPYQRIGFMSDVFRGVPTGQMATTTATAPDPSMFSQLAGLGLGIAGLNQGGLFGEGGIMGLFG
jgi:hypothetical protein|tara:strand:- start:813 stop:1787 length:975 start_codon:yes stop_codon:yes gene_type:complete